MTTHPIPLVEGLFVLAVPHKHMDLLIKALFHKHILGYWTHQTCISERARLHLYSADELAEATRLLLIMTPLEER